MNYPFELQRREAAAIRARRRKANRPEDPATEESESRPWDADPPGAEAGRLPARTVGLAFSGGGVRSATFSLGILQALAKKGRLRDIDLLSTVSGGGLTGGFLGRLFTRNSISGLAANNGDPCGRVESILCDDASPQIKWLLGNADYLVAAGGSNGRQNLALVWRNLVSIYLILIILACLGLAVFGLLRMTGDWIARFVGVPGFRVALGPVAVTSLSSWWWLPLAVLAVAVVPCAIAYWLAPNQDTRASFSFLPLAAWIVLLAFLCIVAPLPSGLCGALIAIAVLLLGVVWLELARPQDPANLNPSAGETSADTSTVIRNRLTRSLGEVLVLFVASLLWVAIDTVARGFDIGKSNSIIATWALLAAPLTPFLRGLANILRSSAAEEDRSGEQSGWFTSAAFRAGIIAFPVAGLLFVLLDAAVHWLFSRDFAWGWAAMVIGAVLSLIFGRAFEFLNYAPLQETFGARISRIFLGASNPARIFANVSDESRNVQLVHPDDDIAFDQYHPEANGGPLHLIGLSLNETVDPASKREARNRKGLPMCVGPCGVSVSQKFHAVWAPQPPAARLPWRLRLRRLLDGYIPPPESAKVALRPIPIPGEIFHVFQGRTDLPVCVESLRLGRWIATSGAAICTGGGRTTSLAISLLLSLVNLRLAYWWDSGLNASDRPGRFPRSFWRDLKVLPVALVKMQSLLICDFLGRFEGPAHRFWNIGDGGHFDNTGLYELLRRRLPFIIAVDGGEDASFAFDDMAELVRQVRIDFGAELEFVDPASPAARPPAWILAWLADPAATMGPLQDIGDREPDRAVESPRQASRPLRKHAALAHVTYDNEHGPATWIVLLKASVTGDESLDIANYKKSNPAFPSEPTTEQFFNESQWESYRALGEHIANTILS